MAQGPATVVQRTVAIMDLLAFARSALDAREITRRTGLPAITVQHLLAILHGAGLVERDGEPGLYRVGPRAFTWGAGFLRQMDLRQVALPHMLVLRDRFEESALLSVLSGTACISIEQVPSRLDVRTTVDLGQPRDLFESATGLALLSRMTEAEFAEAITHAEMTTQRMRELDVRLAEIRERGYAAGDEDGLPGACAVAAPVLDAMGALYALSLVGPAPRMERCLAEAGRAVAAAAREVSRSRGALA